MRNSLRGDSKVGKASLLLDKAHLDIGNLTITVLSKDNLGNTVGACMVLGLGKAVVLRTVDKCYNVGILLDGTRLTKVDFSPCRPQQYRTGLHDSALQMSPHLGW